MAVIGGANADVLELQALFAEQLRQAFHRGDLAIESLAQFAPAFDMYLRMGKQTSQFSNLLLRFMKQKK